MSQQQTQGDAELSEQTWPVVSCKAFFPLSVCVGSCPLNFALSFRGE